MRLLYTNNGVALLALGSNAVHKLWKWQRTDRNPNGKVRVESCSYLDFICSYLDFICYSVCLVSKYMHIL